MEDGFCTLGGILAEETFEFTGACRIVREDFIEIFVAEMFL